MNNIYVPDRWNDCGDKDYYEEEKKCVGCGKYHKGEERYCEDCIKIMLNDADILRFYAKQIEADNYNLKDIKEFAKENLDDFLDSCEEYDKEMGV